MLEKWKVTYLIKNEVLVKTPVLTYPSLDLELQYDEDKLIKCEHTVEIQDLASEEDICQLSNIQLRLFWELIQYKQRKSIQFKGTYAEKVIEEIDRPGVAGIKERMLMRDTANAIVHRKVNMPTEYQLARSNKQLSTWIHFANQAYDSNDVETVRTYYIIYEGIYPCKSK